MKTISITEFLLSIYNRKVEDQKEEFEIYAFQSLFDNNDIVYLQEDKSFKYSKTHAAQELSFSLYEMLGYLKDQDERIYQMRRVSDNKIFTVEEKLASGYLIEEFIYDFDTKEVTVKLKDINRTIPISKLKHYEKA